MLEKDMDKFGKKVILIRGWDFRHSDYENAWKKKELLVAEIETSNLCDLMCEYCFREEYGVKSKKKLLDEISIKQTYKIIDEMLDLGVKTINIVGAGEPTLDENLLNILKYISSNNIVPVVFTHGARLDEKLVESLDKYNSSVIIKLNSFNSTVHDQLVGRYEYTKKRDRGLALLIESGFNTLSENYHTRLGIDCVICRENKEEILEIHKYCRDNNIMPLIKTFIPAGRTRERTDMEITMQEFFELSEKARELDAKEYGIEYQRLMPYLGGVPCTQNGKHSIYVTILGDIFECPGQQVYYGNIKSISVKEAFSRIRNEQNNPDFGCPPRVSYWKRTNQIK